MNAVTEVMDELRKALAEVDDIRASLRRKIRHCDELTEERDQMERERDEARTSCPDCAMWAERSARWHDDMQRAECERDEARASLAQIRRVFGNAIAFDDARGDIVKMAEIAYRGACDGDKAVGELQRVERERDEARAFVADAYRRGAAAMREACARWMSEREGISQWVYDDALSALPIPEEP